MIMYKRIFAGIIAAALVATSLSNAYAEKIILPGVKQIEAETFMNDTALEEVIITDGTTSIGEKAFAGTGLKKVSIPSSVAFIADDAFDGCEDLVASIEDNQYAREFCESHGITFHDPFLVTQQYLQDGVIILPTTTEKGSVFTLNICSSCEWTVTRKHEPGTSNWFTLSSSQGTGNSSIDLTVSYIPGTYSDVKVRDHFLTYLTFTDANEDKLTIPVVIYKSNDPFSNTHWNTGNYLEDLIAVALTQVGYQGTANVNGDVDGILDENEKHGDSQKYGSYMGINGYPWCACFVSWCAFQAGIPTTVMRHTTYAKPGDYSSKVVKGEIPVYYFNSINSTQNKNNPCLLKYGIRLTHEKCNPVRGDLIFFRWDDASYKVTFSHVGIVLANDGEKITYIDGNGNKTDMVWIRTIDRTDTAIAAYVSIFD